MVLISTKKPDENMEKESITICLFISVFLTVIAGLVPSKLAAKKDPAVVLRSE